ncbi:MAG: carboxypeptidase family protein [bacterium]|nr:carboxypeptidase family protein [bacterium]
MLSRPGIYLTTLLLTCGLATGAPAALSINTTFDGGSIGPYVIDDLLHEIDFTLAADGVNYTYWGNFKVSGVSGLEVTFHITNADDVPFLSDVVHESQMVYSYDGQNWFRLTNHSYAGGTYSFTETFSQNQVQIATFLPFSSSRMSDLVDTADASPWASKSVLGQSTQGRDLDLLTITNLAIPSAGKKLIYIVARQHAAETSSSHMLEGLIDFLLSDDVYASGFRDGYIWQIVPMANPDGVYEGNSRANSEGNDSNRDWHSSNHDSVEIDIIRAHLDATELASGIDIFIDRHSQMNDIGGYDFVYSPPGNTFFGILSDWTVFDTEKAVGTSCSIASCSSRGYATSQGLLTFIIELTPHLASWTEIGLKAEGVNSAFALNEYFGMFEAPLLVDSDFGASADDAALRGDAGGLDWLESRFDDPNLLSLDETNVAGNETAKAKLSGSTSANAYLTQRFGWPQSDSFSVQWDIRVDEILDVPGVNTDRTGWMLLGDDTDPTHPGPNSDDSERFVYMAFFRDGGGSPGDTMDLVARDGDDGWSSFTTVASGLTIGQWYTIRVDCDVGADTYRVYVDGLLEGTLNSRQTKSLVSHISFAQWAGGAGTFHVDNVMEPGLDPIPAIQRENLSALVFTLLIALIAGIWKTRSASMSSSRRIFL